MKKIVSLSLAALLTAGALSGAVSAATPMTAEEKYNQLVEQGIFEGFPDGQAHLDENMTRAQAAKIVALVLGLEEDKDAAASSYKDIKGAHWAAGYIGAATQAGILDGMGNGLFNPDADVTIEQLAKIKVLALGLKVDNNNPSDTNGVSDWAKGYVASAVQAGLIASKDDYTTSANRGVLVDSTYETKVTKEAIETIKEENKKNIGKLIALDVFEAKDGTFAGSDKLSKEDVIKIIGVLSDGKFDLSGVALSDSPSFAEILSVYLQVLGYPAKELSDNKQLLDKAIAVGIISADSPLIKIQNLNLPVDRDWAAYVTAETAFKASKVEVKEDGSIVINKDKHLSQTMKLPSTPIPVNLKDIDGVPSYSDFKDIDPVIDTRVTTPTPSPSPGSGNEDTTAPFITAATINGHTVALTNGASGEILLPINLEYLTTGTITINEAATLTITSIDSIDLTSDDFEEGFFTQSLSSGTNNLDLITKLGTLDRQGNGVSISYLSLLDSDNDGNIDINGTLRDRVGNSRNVTLTIGWPVY